MRKNDDLAAWRLLFRASELGSISKTADELNIEPSSVSRRISSLESKTGVQLLTRTSRTIKLTDAGNQAFEKIRPLIDDIDNAIHALNEGQAKPSGLVRLTAPISLGDHDVLVQWLADFQTEYPAVDIDLHLSNSHIDLVEHNIDLALRVGALKDDRVVAHSLGDMHALMCASPDYLKKFGTLKHPRDLKHHRQVIYSGMMARGHIRLSRGDETFDIPTTGQMRINHLNAIHRAVLAGAGIHLIAPLWHCLDDLKSGRLIQLLPDWSLPSSPVHLVRLPRRHLPLRVKLLSQWLTEHWQAWNATLHL